jgi:hypothetical protein
LRLGRGAAVAGEARRASAGHGDDAASIHPADAMIARVDDQHAAVRGHRHAGRERQLRLLRRPAVAGEARLAGAGEGGDDPTQERDGRRAQRGLRLALPAVAPIQHLADRIVDLMQVQGPGPQPAPP